MIQLRSSRVVATAFALAGLVVFSPIVHGCAAVSDQAYTSETFVEAERAVIIWDSAHHIEHFIRQATIRTHSPDLGFLVPTPETPELAEVDPVLFTNISAIAWTERTRPVIYHKVEEFFSPIAYHFQELPADDAPAPTPPPPRFAVSTQRPTVLAEADVAGYHATTLATDDYPSIASWLAQHGYSATPELEAWLKKYGTRKWKITAFQLTKPDAGASYLTTRAVRLSFHTDAPFYPYSEPSDRQQASAASPLGRALRVAVLSDARMTGHLADQTAWPGKLEYAGPATFDQTTNEKKTWTPEQWLGEANLGGAKDRPPIPTVLTTFLDDSNPRPGTADLYFSPDANQAAFRGQEVDYSLPVDYRMTPASLLAAIGAYFFVILVPAAPTYCGWRVHSRYRARTLGLARALRPPRPWLRIVDRLMGAAAIVVGVAYGLHFFIHVAPHDLLGLSELQAPDVGTLAAGSIVILVVAPFCFAVTICGVLVWPAKFAATPTGSAHGNRWSTLCGDFSLFAGGLGIFLMLGLLVQLLEI